MGRCVRNERDKGKPKILETTRASGAENPWEAWGYEVTHVHFLNGRHDGSEADEQDENGKITRISSCAGPLDGGRALRAGSQGQFRRIGQSVWPPRPRQAPAKAIEGVKAGQLQLWLGGKRKQPSNPVTHLPSVRPIIGVGGKPRPTAADLVAAEHVSPAHLT
ncbi:hypothetical protein F5144DRAFT_589096 [Chaetomium tenue]|uniref:Uncharacterized protein n=1 Tax=Chaetomium tenue TaxID=1854479 RepID=A0ACB7PNI3_9PEZI|nr:hypothetical protein F5144DRAFT_589096 [Chaetomium globosum]